MSVGDSLRHFFAFRTAWVTSLTVAVYLAVFVVTEYQDQAKAAPHNTGVLDLAEAYHDLQFVAASPHPYNSRRNDVVHDYLLDRVRSIVKGHDHIEVVEDLISNATYRLGSSVIYHEGLNILVSIGGTEPELDGVLFSAHFDSVSTGHGATDDGMGVVTLLQLIKNFANNPPKRRAVFNINNGEEDGLNGAHVFLEHPFAQSIGTFLNLEGAGSGGRPLLFRTSNARVTRAFKNAPHPHGNTISSDGFKQGLIRSSTDYSVYEQFGMRGLDLAFYRHRSRYHTKYDSVTNLGGTRSLWSMLESSWETAKALTSEGVSSDGDEPALYFDVLGEALAVFNLHTIFIVNTLFLVLGPLLVISLAIFASQKKKLFWSWRGWLRFPIALILTAAVSVALTAVLIRINPFIVYSSVHAVMLSFISVLFLVLFGVLRTASWLKPIPSQRHIILIENYVFWWALLVFDTVFVNIYKIGALYPVNFFHAGAFFALLLGLVEILLLRPKTTGDELPNNVDDPNVVTAVTVEREEQNHDDANEQTPLLTTRRKVVALKSDLYDEKQAGGLWIGQYLLAIPFPVLFASQTILFALYSMNQTLSDGGKPQTIYTFALVFAVLIVLPLAPFIHKLHWGLVTFVGILFVASALYNVFAFPFNPSEPLKVFFRQDLDLDTGSNNVILEGVSSFLRRPIIDQIPSASKGNIVWCTDKSIRPFLKSCHWPGAEPSVGGNKGWWGVGAGVDSLLTFTATRTNDTNAVFTIKGRNTRTCRIYFDKPIFSVSVHGASNGGSLQRGYEIGDGGVTVVKLWSRTWDKEFVVDIGLDEKIPSPLKGKVACEWSEKVNSQIPALDEIITFLPTWAVVTKADDGLVEGSRKFEI